MEGTGEIRRSQRNKTPNVQNETNCASYYDSNLMSSGYSSSKDIHYHDSAQFCYNNGHDERNASSLLQKSSPRTMSNSLKEECELMDDLHDIEPSYQCGYFKPIGLNSLEKLIGKNKGIQGRENSCYLDATLFAMFACTDTFDSLLLRPKNPEDPNQSEDFRSFLREGVVNVLRSTFAVKSTQIRHLRNLLDLCDSSGGFLNKERDPEEVLNIIFTKLIPTEHFLSFESGGGTHIFELFVNQSVFKNKTPTVQMLLDRAFYDEKLFLNQTPSVLILQLPRISKTNRMFDKIIPSIELDITPLVKKAPHSCIFCSKLAEFCITDSFNKCMNGFADMYYCKSCVLVPQSQSSSIYLDKQRFEHLHDPELIRRSAIKLELFAVLCIETSHYVCYSRCEDKWIYFNSMSDQQKHINIPEVVVLPNFVNYLNGQKEKNSNSMKSCSLDEVKITQKNFERIKSDAYICFYRNPSLANYR